jgi:hypothetical protein
MTLLNSSLEKAVQPQQLTNLEIRLCVLSRLSRRKAATVLNKTLISPRYAQSGLNLLRATKSVLATLGMYALHGERFICSLMKELVAGTGT